MRRLSAVLMGLGVLLGAGVSAAMLLDLGFAGLHWMILVGLAKLTLAGALGLIAAGAVVRRLAIRAEERRLSVDEETRALGAHDSDAPHRGPTAMTRR